MSPRSNRRRSGRPAVNDDVAQPMRQNRRLNPETRHGVAVVLILTAAVVTALSVFGLAGGLGQMISNGLGSIFGWQRFTVPLYLAVVGYLLLFPERYYLAAARWLGFVVMLTASEALLQLWLPLDVSIKRAIAGEGGGYLGVLLDYPLRSALGSIATACLLIGLLMVGWLVMLNTSLSRLVQSGLTPGRWLTKIRQTNHRPKPDGQSEASQIANEQGALEFTKREVEPAAHHQSRPEPPAVAAVPKKRRPATNLPLDLLDLSSTRPNSGNIEANKEKIQRTLQNFGIQVEMGEVNVGPTVTQFTLAPTEGVKLSQITSLSNDLALALAAHPIRIEAPIPGKSLVGIEVPNQSVAIVNLRDIIGSTEFKQRRSNLTFSLGKDVSGQPWVADLDPLPHLLVAGATGSGKSVLINGLIISLLSTNSPDDVKLILVDPKRVELTLYNGIPHLLTPVITDTVKTINALRWVVSEMDRRFSVLSNAGKRNISAYRRDGGDMPYIVLIIDELADLMAVAANEVEGAIVRLAQMARAVGIHLVLATQRPSVDVITGLIKANVTARIAFSVASGVDSRTILDVAGAEKLLGKGDMLLMTAELSKPKRLQGAFVSEKEVERVVQFLKTQAEPEYLAAVVEKAQPQLGASLEDLGDDELLAEAKQVISQAGKASASLLQRRLRIGYARAARILDLLEEEGFIGPGEGAKPREVYVQSGTSTMERDADIPPPTEAPEPEAEDHKDSGQQA